MVPSERRTMPRFKLRIPLSFHCLEPQSEGAVQAKTINISAGGIYFVTSLIMSAGTPVEVRLEMPERVTGVKAGSRRFTGRVAHVESKNVPQGCSGVGVQLLYYVLATAA